MPISSDPEKRAKQIAALKQGANGLQGRKKGSRNWSTVVKELLDNEELFATLVENMERKPQWLEPVGTKTLMEAITTAQAIRAMGGNHLSAEWLRKTGFGDKIDLTSNGETIKIEPIVVSTIRPRQIVEAEIIEPAEDTDDGATT